MVENNDMTDNDKEFHVVDIIYRMEVLLFVV